MEEIRDWKKVLGSVRDFRSWVGNALPGLMDLDGFCERHGRFLVLEGKPIQGGGKVVIAKGQWLALKALSRISEFTVYIVAQDPDKSNSRKFAVANVDDLTWPYKYRGDPTFDTNDDEWDMLTVKGMQRLAKRWWEYASAV